MYTELEAEKKAQELADKMERSYINKVVINRAITKSLNAERQTDKNESKKNTP